MKNLNTYIFLVVCFVILIFPVIGFRYKDTISQYENRTLTKLDISKDKSIKENISNFESWFNDHIGYRDELLEVNTYIQWSVFGNLTHPRHFVGQNGQWFWAGDPYKWDDYQKVDTLSQEELKNYVDSIAKLNEYLKSQSINFIYMINMDKQQIYTEDMLSSVNVVGEKSKTDQIMEALESNTDVDVFWTKDALLDAKREAQVYWKRYDSSHWNFAGAYVGYLELMKHIENYDEEFVIFDDPGFEEKTINSKMYGVVDNSEPYYSYNIDMSGVVIDKNYMGSANLTSPNTYFNYYNEQCPNDEVILIFGDSYIYSYMMQPLSQSFKQVIFFHFQDIGNLKTLISEFNPDYVLLENVERSFTLKIGENINSALQ